MDEIQKTINKIWANDFTISELKQYLNSSLVLVKTNAIIAVLREHITDKSVLNELNNISNNVQIEPIVIGEWTTGHFALAVLYLLDADDAKKIYDDNVRKLGEEGKNIKKIINQILHLINESK